MPVIIPDFEKKNAEIAELKLQVVSLTEQLLYIYNKIKNNLGEHDISILLNDFDKSWLKFEEKSRMRNKN